MLFGQVFPFPGAAMPGQVVYGQTPQALFPLFCCLSTHFTWNPYQFGVKNSIMPPAGSRQGKVMKPTGPRNFLNAFGRHAAVSQSIQPGHHR